MRAKKTILLTSFLLSSALVLGACLDDDEVTKDTTNNNTSNDIKDSNPGENPEDLPAYTFGFKRFELHVDSSNQDDSIDVLYNVKKDATDVEYTNKFTDENLTGSDAMDQLEPILKSLSITEDLTSNEVIEQIVKAFKLEDDYTSIEAEVTYLNGDTKEYALMK
jgi:hypothetical protein